MGEKKVAKPAAVQASTKSAAKGKTITKQIAKQYLNDPDAVDLNSFERIDRAAAVCLADYTGKYLTLNGIKELPAAAADGLAEYMGYRIELNGLGYLDESAAEGLARYSGSLIELNALTSLSDAAAKTLAAFAGRLDLDGITTLSDSVASSLAKHKGSYLSLNGITWLTSKAATALARHRGHVSLRGLAVSTEAGTADDTGDRRLSAESLGRRPNHAASGGPSPPPATICSRGLIYADDEETYDVFMQDGGFSSMRFVEAGAAILPAEVRGVGLQVKRPEDVQQFIAKLGHTPYSYLCYVDASGSPVDVVICQHVRLDALPDRIEELRRFLTLNGIEYQDCGDSAASCVWGSSEFEDNRMDM